MSAGSSACLIRERTSCRPARTRRLGPGSRALAPGRRSDEARSTASCAGPGARGNGELGPYPPECPAGPRTPHSASGTGTPSCKTPAAASTRRPARRAGHSPCTSPTQTATPASGGAPRSAGTSQSRTACSTPWRTARKPRRSSQGHKHAAQTEKRSQFFSQGATTAVRSRAIVGSPPPRIPRNSSLRTVGAGPPSGPVAHGHRVVPRAQRLWMRTCSERPLSTVPVGGVIGPPPPGVGRTAPLGERALHLHRQATR
jgi:hypothetical protein